MSHWQRRGLAALSGLLLWFSFPNPLALGFEAWPGWLAWGALLPLLAALEGEDGPSAAKLGFVAGLACFVPGLVWLTNVKPLGPGALPAWLGLAAWCAAFPALFAAATARGLRQGWAQPVLWVPALWALSELLREQLLGGFPWMGLGSSQYRNGAVLPLAAALGQAGLHYAVALGNAVLFGILVRQSWLLRPARSLGAAAMLLLLALLAQGERAAQARWDLGPEGADGPRVAVIQGGINLDQAWDFVYRRTLLERYFELGDQAVAQGAELLLWPESAFPGFFNEDAPEARELKAWAAERKVTMLVGSTQTEGGTYTNSAVWLDADGSTRSYAKRHLVPFGEYVPFTQVAPLLDLALKRAGVLAFSPGQGPGRFQLGDHAVKPLICYESVFPELAREGGSADLLAVLTVDTWYGRSAGPVWHASQSALRAVEQGAWLARSAATGISLFAAPNGALLHPIALDTAGFAVQKVGRARPTPYQRWGLLPVLLICALTLVMGYLSRKKG